MQLVVSIADGGLITLDAAQKMALNRFVPRYALGMRSHRSELFSTEHVPPIATGNSSRFPSSMT